MFTILLLLVWPLIDLIGLATGAATVAFISHECASSASKQPTYDLSLSACLKQSQLLESSDLAKFAKLVPVSGFNGSGVDLYVDASSFVANATKRYGPNIPVPAPIDQSTWIANDFQSNFFCRSRR